MEKLSPVAARALASRFRGAALGAAIGDALALPNQHYSRAFLSSLAQSLVEGYALPPGTARPRGQYGAKTQVLLVSMASIVEAKGIARDSLLAHMIPLWRDNLLVERADNTTEAMLRALKGPGGPESAALEIGRADSEPLDRAVATGLWDAGRPEKIADDIRAAVGITHSDPRVAGCAAAAAAGVASNVRVSKFILGEFLDRTAEAAGAFDPALRDGILDFPRILCQTERRALRLLASFSPDTRYPQTEEGLGEYCVPAVLSAFYWFLRHPFDFEKTVENCLRLGGQMAATAFVAGALSGALLGEERLPEHLLEGLLGRKEIARQAQELFEAWSEPS